MLTFGVEMAAAFLCPQIFGPWFQGFRSTDQLTEAQTQLVSVIADVVLVYMAEAAQSRQPRSCSDAAACADAGLPLGEASRDAAVWTRILLEMLDQTEAESGLTAMQSQPSRTQNPVVSALIHKFVVDARAAAHDTDGVEEHYGGRGRRVLETTDRVQAISDVISTVSRVILATEGTGAQLIESVAQFAHVAHRWTLDAMAVSAGTLSASSFR